MENLNLFVKSIFIDNMVFAYPAERGSFPQPLSPRIAAPAKMHAAKRSR